MTDETRIAPRPPEVIGDEPPEVFVRDTVTMDTVEYKVMTVNPESPRFSDGFAIDIPLSDESVETRTLDPEAADPSGDPRFHERRVAVVSEARSRRHRVLVSVVSVVALLLAAVGVTYSPLLDVDRIDIIGSDLLDLDGLRDATGVGVGSPIVFVDPGEVETKLRDDPRFSRVAVARQFPSSVSIRLTERRAIARVAGPTLGVVVGEGGVVISVARGDELLRRIDVDEDPTTRPGGRLNAPLAAAVDVVGAMSFEVTAQIFGVRVASDGQLTFDLGDGRTVLFGPIEDVEAKLLAVRTMLGPQIDTRGLCQLDVRVPTAPTMRRDPDCDAPVEPPAPEILADPAAPDGVTPDMVTPDTIAPDPAPAASVPPETVPAETVAA